MSTFSGIIVDGMQEVTDEFLDGCGITREEFNTQLVRAGYSTVPKRLEGEIISDVIRAILNRKNPVNTLGFKIQERQEQIKDLPEVCDYCLTAVYDMDPSMDLEMQTMVAVEMGIELSDHLCDVNEEPDLDINCECSCPKRGRGE